MLEVPLDVMICRINNDSYHKPTIRPILSISKPVSKRHCIVTLFCQFVVYFSEAKLTELTIRNDTNQLKTVMACLQVKDRKSSPVKKEAEKNDTIASLVSLSSINRLEKVEKVAPLIDII
jgi:hypothetical protein